MEIGEGEEVMTYMISQGPTFTAVAVGSSSSSTIFM